MVRLFYYFEGYFDLTRKLAGMARKRLAAPLSSSGNPILDISVAREAGTLDDDAEKAGKKMCFVGAFLWLTRLSTRRRAACCLGLDYYYYRQNTYNKKKRLDTRYVFFFAFLGSSAQKAKYNYRQ